MRESTLRTTGATLVLAGIVIVALLQAASGDASPVEIDPQESPSTIPVRQTASTVATSPFEYRIGLLGGPTTDNFWAFYGRDETSWNAYVLGATKPALYSIDPGSNALVADLAAEETPPEPELVDDVWSVTVSLRSDVTWSDGAPVTAGDVAFTFDTVRRLELGGSWASTYPSGLIDVVAVADHELRLEFAGRPGLGEWPHAVGLAPVMPAHVWESVAKTVSDDDHLYDLEATRDVSGGPLVLVETAAGSIIAAVNHERIESSVDTVIFEIFEEELSAANALVAGDIDTILSPNGVSADTVDLVAGESGVAVERSPANSVRYLGFNLDRFPMGDPAFRRAVSLIFDRVGAVSSINPEAAPAFGLLPEDNRQWFHPDQSDAIAKAFVAPLEDRLAAALAALEDSGYTWSRRPAISDGALVSGEGLQIAGSPPAPLTILTPGDLYDPDRPKYAAAIEEVLETLGFDVRPVVTDFDTVVDLAFDPDPEQGRQYDMYLLGWTLGNPSYPDFYEPLFARSGVANSTGYDSAAFDRLLGRFDDAVTKAEALSLLWRIERRLAKDLPYLTIYHPLITEVYRSDRVSYELSGLLGGIQGRGGALADVKAVD